MSGRAGAVELVPVTGIGEIRRGTDLGTVIRDALRALDLRLADGDVLVVSSKIVSKALGMRESTDDKQALVLRHSHRIVTERETPNGVTRVVHAKAGPVMVAAGIDASNVGDEGGYLTLPHDPDLAARSLYAELLAAYAPSPVPMIGIVLSDTAGRPWRLGQTDFALGSCGVAVLDDLRGGQDADGRDLTVTSRAVADEVAAAADLVKGKVGGIPVALVRGLPDGTVTDPGAPGASYLVRTGPDDWFAHGVQEAVRAALGVEPGTAAAAQIGLPSVLPEDDRTRLDRAVRLARFGEPEGSTVEESPDDTGHLTLRVSGPDPVPVGRLAARLEVALRAERLAPPQVRVEVRGG